MFYRKKESGSIVKFRSGKIKELLEKMNFISELSEGEHRWNQAFRTEIQKTANALRYEMKSCKPTWGEGSNLETALCDVLHVLDKISRSESRELTDMDVGYAYMGRIQGLFFITNKISSHCPGYYQKAAAFYAEEKNHLTSALAMEKRTFSELAYDKVVNAEAIKETNARISRMTQQIQILNDMIQGIGYMKEQQEKELPETEDCDEAAEAEGAEITENLDFPDEVFEESVQSQTIVSDKMEDSSILLLQASEDEQKEEPEQKQDPDPITISDVEEYPKEKGSVSIFRSAAELFHRKKKQETEKEMEPDEPVEMAYPMTETVVFLQESREILFAPGKSLFLDKNGHFCYGKTVCLEKGIYRNKELSAYRLQISRMVYDLLTVTYDPALYNDLTADDLSSSRSVMKWIYEHSMGTGDRLPLNKYIDYQNYYSKCAGQFLELQEKERMRKLKANLMAGEAADLAILYNRVSSEDIAVIRNTYVSHILNCEADTITTLLEDIIKIDVTDADLKKRIERLIANLMQKDIAAAGCGNEKSEGANVCSDIFPQTNKPSDQSLDENFFHDIRNMRLLLKKEDVNGDMEIKTASFQHISYLVKQFYIMLSYSKELGMDYNGQQIWLIRYDNERRIPVPIMSVYEKHIRHLDQGKTGAVVHYMEQKYQYLLNMYADISE